MFSKRLLAAVFIVCLGAAAPAFAIDSYPGSTWGELLWQVPALGPQPNIPDLLTDGWIRQGADVAHFDGMHLVPYVTLRWTVDTRGLSWNNTVGPGIGISLLTSPLKNSSVTIGIENIWNYYDRDWQWSTGKSTGSPNYEPIYSGDPSRLTDTVNVYMDWYGWWDLGK